MEKKTSTQQEVINDELSDQEKKAEHPSTQQEVINELSENNEADALSQDEATVPDPSPEKSKKDDEENGGGQA